MQTQQQHRQAGDEERIRGEAAARRRRDRNALRAYTGIAYLSTFFAGLWTWGLIEARMGAPYPIMVPLLAQPWLLVALAWTVRYAHKGRMTEEQEAQAREEAADSSWWR